jgi:hypothetical protein
VLRSDDVDVREQPTRGVEVLKASNAFRSELLVSLPLYFPTARFNGK